jgi:polar amino acid transport system substrate-binding protein
MKPMVVSRCFFLLRALFLICVVAAASTAHATDSSDPLSMPLMFDLRERIPKPDLAPVPRIRFLTTVDFPPFNFIDQSGKLSGFHVELAREICRELAVLERCQIEALPYKDLQPALEKGSGEVVLAGLKVTPELRRTFGFSRVFMQLPARFVIRKTAGNTTTSPDTLPAGQLGVVQGTAHEEMLKAFFPALKAKTFTTRPIMLAALRKGDIQAAFGDGLQLSFWLESDDAADCCAYLGGPYYSSFFFGDGLAMMTRKDSPQITRALDHALIALARSGRLNDIYLRYFPNGL